MQQALLLLKTPEKRQEWFEKFYNQLVSLKFIPAGRVIYGAGSETDVTFFNCYVMPFVADSREGSVIIVSK